ncbi:GNAT family N-acetyltransferase [Alginatibacterium sediminis]|uniref:GNAT family N-acetyltransferase n=1 Tax=Alginatibacterium sediminis TaxID=2164068 RepID=A0A420E9Q7_9ALTE|nr:GNAT family N-acetyltransferase [Alginatibacterium sediminis]RKF17404.1 GNAT family N-acetyltransferase [Alginatibacterium sediminis]
MDIIEVSSIEGIEPQLQDLLVNCIEDGASLGFLTPSNQDEVKSYWHSVEQGLQNSSRKLFVALHEQQVLGTVQLALCSKANGSHRGEVEKLMVNTQARGQGIARQLMQLMEEHAAEIGLSLLVLDTRFGDVASTLYRNNNYIEAGSIPQFARSSSGELEATVYFYKLL